MKFIMALVLGVWTMSVARAQDISTNGTFRLQGVILQMEGTTALAVSYFNVMKIDVAKGPKSVFGRVGALRRPDAAARRPYRGTSAGRADTPRRNRVKVWVRRVGGAFQHA
jgi:hypothetical protein